MCRTTSLTRYSLSGYKTLPQSINLCLVKLQRHSSFQACHPSLFQKAQNHSSFPPIRSNVASPAASPLSPGSLLRILGLQSPNFPRWSILLPRGPHFSPPPGSQTLISLPPPVKLPTAPRRVNLSGPGTHPLNSADVNPLSTESLKAGEGTKFRSPRLTRLPSGATQGHPPFFASSLPQTKRARPHPLLSPRTSLCLSSPSSSHSI